MRRIKDIMNDMSMGLGELARRVRGFRKDSEGFVLMSTLAIFLLLFLFCSSIYAISETIHQRVRLQNACDSAAYSAAVIQADGLSRMASINRAMSWTYVQMTNRQMDYITYRWLKLTCQQFAQDLNNAGSSEHKKGFAQQLVLPLDKEVTAIGMVIEAICALAVNSVLDWLRIPPTCYGNGPGNHYDEGLAYWAGTGKGVNHEININGLPPDFDLSLRGAWEKLVDTVAQSFTTKDVIDKFLDAVKFAFDMPDKYDSPNPYDWGGLLGELIDYDKTNINMMNNSLSMINELMTLSMKTSSENILKASLKDRRMNDEDILKDYHISIKIPHSPNPYDVENMTDVPDSYFSALHNTEADERLFLQMHSEKDAEGNDMNAGKKLPQLFPVLLESKNSGSPAYGLDQWFIRGCGVYVNEKEENESCFMPQEAKPSFSGGRSGWVTNSGSGLRLEATRRDEGSLGIQRVYKDANLNETKAGFFMGKPEMHPARYGVLRQVTTNRNGSYRTTNYVDYSCNQNDTNGHVNPEGMSKLKSEFKRAIEESEQILRQREEPCCSEKINFYCVHKGGRRAKTYWVIWEIPAHRIRKVSRNPVSRGNHIVSFKSLLDEVSAAVDGFIQGKEGGGQRVTSDPIKEIDNKIDLCDKEILAAQAAQRLETDPAQQAAYQLVIENRRKEKKALEEARQKMVDAGVTTSSEGHSGQLRPPTNGSGNGDTGVTTSSEGHSDSQSSGGGVIGEALSKLTSLMTGFLSNLAADALDVQASCGNSPSLPYEQYPMCRSISNDTYALYSQYRWASAKWYCVTDFVSYLVCLIFNHRKVFCDYLGNDEIEIIKHILSYTVSGKGHYHIPKWFCGTRPDSLGDPFGQSELINAIGGKYFIPVPLPGELGKIQEKSHGYMKATGDLSNMIKPIGQLFGSVDHVERDEFQSCVPFFDGNPNFLTVNTAYAGVIQGHARIYGDDKRIFDNRYVGAKCKPWVLNERFFADEGTIVVGAAMKHRNPFVQLFDLLSRSHTDEQNMPESHLLSAFNVPNGNVMWTMAAARAGVRRHRRNGLFDQERQYQIAYDPTSDAENLWYATGPFYYHPDYGKWMTIIKDARDKGFAWEVNDNNNLAFTRADVPGQKTVAAWNGCPCNGLNTKAFSNVWNLCEWDWDATLIPVRYAGAHARIKLVEENGRPMRHAGDRFDKLSYNERLEAIDDMQTVSNKNADYELASNDDYIGDGRHWVWDMDGVSVAKSWDRDPFLTSVWKRADSQFFDDIVAAVAQGVGNAGAAYLNNKYQDLDLKPKTPMDESDAEAEERFLMLLRSNRIL